MFWDQLRQQLVLRCFRWPSWFHPVGSWLTLRAIKRRRPKKVCYDHFLQTRIGTTETSDRLSSPRQFTFSHSLQSLKVSERRLHNDLL
ncbi:hypothetical protein PHYPO_G00059790 [Pangasianodon hypophthalmus]|uniref:Uncharacterized protein n=1 Tax=Pangasianodon hypophthalmus TaxID=310915 RepID=A0A5N5M364_PANHP|nr:hypothetical protein PHYPO_G00059790 [Pangasianodon hypophthalmus]